MDIMGFITSSLWLIVALAVIIFVVVPAIIVWRLRYKVAGADEALVITGGKKEARVLPGGGAFIPWGCKSDFFPLGVMTVRSDDQETHTVQMIPVVVKWTAQLRADVETEGALEKAVRGFGGYDSNDISGSLKQTLDGEVRAVVATMTPEQVITDKVNFADQVTKGVAPRMEELGYKLVSLNIAEVSDKGQHYENLAAKDREAKREAAETLKAEAQKAIDIKVAETKRASTEAELARDLAIDEKRREVTLRQAAIKIETDTATADADVAGELQREVRNQELAARRGEVAVVEAQQDQLAADAQRAAALTRAETERQRDVIAAQARKDQDEIAAAAKARQDEIAAEAAAKVAERKAAGQARAAREEAQGHADAVNLTADAEADKVRKTGLAEAEMERAKGEAKAAAILAEGKAEAEAERELAEARAAHGGVNKEIEIAKINATARVEIATAYGTAMHEVGKNVTILQTGGGGASGGGNLLTNLLGGLPGLAKELDVQSEVLNGTSFNDVLAGLVNSIKGNAPAVVVAGEATDTADGGFQLPEGVTLDSIAESLGVDPTDIVEAAQSLGLPAPDGQESLLTEDGGITEADGDELT